MTQPTGQTAQEVRPNKMYAFKIAFIAAVGGFLFGYDLNIMGGAQLYLKDYFELDENSWSFSNGFGFTVSSAMMGCVLGPIAGGWLCDKIGRKKSLMLAATLFGVSAIWTAIPKSIETFNIFRIIGGVGVGLASVASPMYIAEVAPVRLRGRMVTMNQLAIVVGSLVAIIVSYFIAEGFAPEVSWRWMFGSELVPIALFIIFLFMIPESPRWYAEKNRHREALDVLTKVDGAEAAQREMREIAGSLNLVQGRFLEVFSPGIRFAVGLGVFLALMGQLTGWSVIAFYMPTIFKLAGVAETTSAIRQAIIPNAGNLVFTFVGIALVDSLGRRPLYLACSVAMIFSTALLGILIMMGVQGWPIVLAVTMCAWPHAIGMGALAWLILSEIFPTRLRARGMMIGSFATWVTAWLASFSFPVLFSFSEKLTQSAGPTFFIFSCVCIFCFFAALKIVPETKGRSLEEISASWLKK